MKPRVTLGNATLADLAEAARERARKDAEKKVGYGTELCKRCQKPFQKKKKWQVFCNDSCRVIFFFDEEEKRKARVQEERDRFEKENDQLRQENAALKLRIQELTK